MQPPEWFRSSTNVESVVVRSTAPNSVTIEVSVGWTLDVADPRPTLPRMHVSPMGAYTEADSIRLVETIKRAWVEWNKGRAG